MTKVSLEDEITNHISSEIAKEIDFEIMSDLLVASGWVKVVLRPMTWERGAEIDLWTELNVKGKFQTMGLVWIFEKSEDANWFALRWLN